MCGFVGFVNAEQDKTKNREIIQAMADRIVHRGPDQDDYYVDDHVSLGFRRLSIIDLDGGSQPITNADDTKVIVYNGEIYNYQELRAELIEQGYAFKTRTDTEVILHGYEAYGKDILNRLRGMFAFVIWDTEQQKLFGARDIFGIKPFFYYRNEGNFLFGSEIKSFLPNPLFKKEFNEERLPDYLCFEYIPTNQTMFRNVFKLDPGGYFEYANGTLQTGRYFIPKYEVDDTHDLKYWEDLIDETFKGSTIAHGIADVEVGCFLSSGVDSSYVAHEMAKRNDVKTFSVGYAEEKYSELDRAVRFAEHEGIRNYTKKITAEEYFAVAPMVQYYMDEPLPNPSALALYFLAGLASEQVKVVLSGEGADELFGGYHYYREPLDFEKYMKLPQGLRNVLGSLAEKLPAFHGKRFLTRGRYGIEERFIRNNYVYNHAEVDKVLAKKIPSQDPAVYTKPFFDEVQGEDDITKMQYADICTWLVQDILVKADRMSMAHSLELRVPYLDREMLRIALQIPSKYKINSETTKLALRGAAAKELPEDTSKMRKTGFLTPLNDWLRRDEFYEMVKEQFHSDTAREYFNTDYIMKLLDDHKAGTAHNMKKIWSIYSFLLWYEMFFIKN
ncbi:MAG: asparagine synthase (glutamine-hydrolyzing) [Oscillospiraceae bacterium]|nr:asparagine synthase (glutamine-hydrolyzing) [Oscillospiraceae bacterium]